MSELLPLDERERRAVDAIRTAACALRAAVAASAAAGQYSWDNVNAPLLSACRLLDEVCEVLK